MKRKPAPARGIVYSTGQGRMCPRCGRPAARCTCRVERPRASSDGIARVGRETKGRKGKGVTLVTGLPLPEAELAALAKELKRICGSGGTVKDGAIEIQGDHRDRLVKELEARGCAVKRTGG